MNIEQEPIKDLASLINVVRDVNVRFNGQVWWRGQTKECWKLLPSVYRINIGYEYEQNIIKVFKQRAPSRSINTPGTGDHFSWLFLMQHHGLPTRLLDWTESPLFACFFAVENEDYQDYEGALFALCPYKLNLNQVNVSGVLLPGDGLAERAINNAFSDKKVLADYVVGILPSEMHVRIMVQLSVFTLHGSKQPLDDMAGNSDFLLKFLIPKEAKNDLKGQLKTIGVRESNLFPDLDHLAKEIKALRFREPPKTEISMSEENPLLADPKNYLKMVSST